MTTTFPDETSLRIERRMLASPERVWYALTDPEQMAAWMWGGWGSDTAAESDLRVGGRYEVYTTAPEPVPDWPTDRWGFAGYYCEIDPGSRLIYTLHWDGPVGYNQKGERVPDEFVIVDLVGGGDATMLTMQHFGIPADGMSAQEHGKGLEATFDVLEQMLAADSG